MRPFLVCLLVAVLPAACLARQENFCEDKISHGGRLFGRPAYQQLKEHLPGSVVFKGDGLIARAHGIRAWFIEGKLEEELPTHSFVLDPVAFEFDHPSDFEGPFTGHIDRGEIVLTWDRGGTIRGLSSLDDFDVEGKSHIQWSSGHFKSRLRV